VIDSRCRLVARPAEVTHDARGERTAAYVPASTPSRFPDMTTVCRADGPHLIAMVSRYFEMPGLDRRRFRRMDSLNVVMMNPPGHTRLRDSLVGRSRPIGRRDADCRQQVATDLCDHVDANGASSSSCTIGRAFCHCASCAG